MGTSAISAVRELILEVVRFTAQGEWKVFLLDDGSRGIVDAVMKHDDILQENVTNIEQIEQKRGNNSGLNAVYFLTPQPYVVDCLVADLECRRKLAHLIAVLPPDLRQKLDRAPGASEQIASFRTLNVDFFPRESHLITFRDPWSFPILYHPACNQLVAKHMYDISQKIVSVCVSLGEYPTIRFFRPSNPSHEASVLCSHLARFVQDGLDEYAKYHSDFPPPSPRPRGVLILTDRTMDLFAPLVHEFTYQAMVHELLPLKEGDKTFYHTTVNAGLPNQEAKDMELGDNDKIWVENRHLHMKDLLEKLVTDFNRFRAENPQFADEAPSTLNTIKDMIAGLPQFQEGKELYSLHLNMAQECMNIFQKCKLPDIASVEQSMATGLDEDWKKPRNLADQVVRLLDDDAVSMQDRLRLVIEYILHRDGVFGSDIEKLLAHAQLPPQDNELILNMDLLGARTMRQTKEFRSTPAPLFPRKQPLSPATEEVSLSRFDPTIKTVVEEQIKGTLDQNVFPYTKPMLDNSDALNAQLSMSQSSLRSAKPTWARTRPSAMEPRQRIFVFVAGGATYSESRACYEISRQYSRDVFLATSHMLTPGFFLQQVGDLSVDRRQLDLPNDRPPRKAPPHVFESEIKAQAPSAGLAKMTISSGAQGRTSNGTPPPPPKPEPSSSQGFPVHHSGKLNKEPKEPKEKKKGFFRF